jgi:hypothetical protein
MDNHSYQNQRMMKKIKSKSKKKDPEFNKHGTNVFAG